MAALEGLPPLPNIADVKVTGPEVHLGEAPEWAQSIFPSYSTHQVGTAGGKNVGIRTLVVPKFENNTDQELYNELVGKTTGLHDEAFRIVPNDDYYVLQHTTYQYNLYTYYMQTVLPAFIAYDNSATEENAQQLLLKFNIVTQIVRQVATILDGLISKKQESIGTLRMQSVDFDMEGVDVTGVLITNPFPGVLLSQGGGSPFYINVAEKKDSLLIDPTISPYLVLEIRDYKSLGEYIRPQLPPGNREDKDVVAALSRYVLAEQDRWCFLMFLFQLVQGWPEAMPWATSFCHDTVVREVFTLSAVRNCFLNAGQIPNYVANIRFSKTSYGKVLNKYFSDGFDFGRANIVDYGRRNYLYQAEYFSTKDILPAFVINGLSERDNAISEEEEAQWRQRYYEKIFSTSSEEISERGAALFPAAIPFWNWDSYTITQALMIFPVAFYALVMFQSLSFPATDIVKGIKSKSQYDQQRILSLINFFDEEKANAVFIALGIVKIEDIATHADLLNKYNITQERLLEARGDLSVSKARIDQPQSLVVYMQQSNTAPELQTAENLQIILGGLLQVEAERLQDRNLEDSLKDYGKSMNVALKTIRDRGEQLAEFNHLAFSEMYVVLFKDDTVAKENLAAFYEGVRKALPTLQKNAAAFGIPLSLPTVQSRRVEGSALRRTPRSVESSATPRVEEPPSVEMEE